MIPVIGNIAVILYDLISKLPNKSQSAGNAAPLSKGNNGGVPAKSFEKQWIEYARKKQQEPSNEALQLMRQSLVNHVPDTLTLPKEKKLAAVAKDVLVKDLFQPLDEAVEMMVQMSDDHLKKFVSHYFNLPPFSYHNELKNVIQQLTNYPDAEVRKAKIHLLITLYVNGLKGRVGDDKRIIANNIEGFIQCRNNKALNLTNLFEALSDEKEWLQLMVGKIDTYCDFNGGNLDVSHIKRFSADDSRSLQLLVNRVVTHYVPHGKKPSSLERIKILIDHWGMEKVIQAAYKNISKENGWATQVFLELPNFLRVTRSKKNAIYKMIFDAMKKQERVPAEHLAEFIKAADSHWLIQLPPLLAGRDDIQLDITRYEDILYSDLLLPDLDPVYRKLIKPVVMQLDPFSLQKGDYRNLLTLYPNDDEVIDKLVTKEAVRKDPKIINLLDQKQINRVCAKYLDLFVIPEKLKKLQVCGNVYSGLIEACSAAGRQNILLSILYIEMADNPIPSNFNTIIDACDPDTITKASNHYAHGKQFRQKILQYDALFQKESVLIAAFSHLEDFEELNSLNAAQKSALIPGIPPQMQLLLGREEAIDPFIEELNNKTGIGIYFRKSAEFFTHIQEDLLIKLVAKLTHLENEEERKVLRDITSLLRSELINQRRKRVVNEELIRKLQTVFVSFTPEQIKAVGKNLHPLSSEGLLNIMNPEQFHAYLSLWDINEFIPKEYRRITYFLEYMPFNAIHDILAEKDKEAFYLHISSCITAPLVKSRFSGDINEILIHMLQSKDSWQLQYFCEEKKARGCIDSIYYDSFPHEVKEYINGYRAKLQRS